MWKVDISWPATLTEGRIIHSAILRSFVMPI
jgi:hypothetical protein